MQTIEEKVEGIGFRLDHFNRYNEQRIEFEQKERSTSEQINIKTQELIEVHKKLSVHHGERYKNSWYHIIFMSFTILEAADLIVALISEHHSLLWYIAKAVCGVLFFLIGGGVKTVENIFPSDERKSQIYEFDSLKKQAEKLDSEIAQLRSVAQDQLKQWLDALHRTNDVKLGIYSNIVDWCLQKYRSDTNSDDVDPYSAKMKELLDLHANKHFQTY